MTTKDMAIKLMKFYLTSFSVFLVIIIFFGFFSFESYPRDAVLLPKPTLKGKKSVEEAIVLRRTTRCFEAKHLTLLQISQILWAAQGITSEGEGFRTTPSAGALYPLDIFIVVGAKGVEGLRAAVYQYIPEIHSLKLVTNGDVRFQVARAALLQMWIAQAPISIVITGEYARCTKKYGERGNIYTHIEAGHTGQNIFLQAEGIGLGAGIVGAFYNKEIAKVLGIPYPTYDPLLIMPVGFKKE
ncbi:MAG: SagB/ThcOx family dehydrogenase [Thermodesulfobacteriota bacterium]|nr:SagB/ThcOx family dehydrogenase [Thermodesulfobacteriota bacterium]